MRRGTPAHGKPITFDTYEEAAEKAKWYMENLASSNVSYYPREMSQEMDEAPAQGMYMKL